MISLDGQAASWYSQNDMEDFADFDQLRKQFIQIFHRRVPQRELMSLFYAITQEATEMGPHFFIRFENLRKTLTRSSTQEELTETFLTAFREPLDTDLAVVDLTGKPIEHVMSRVLRLDNAHSMSMTTLQRVFRVEEETRVRQAVQCTTCLNPDHFSLDCTLRTRCPICHSKTHTIDHCEYNLLNKETILV